MGIGRTLIVLGAALLAAGLFLTYGPKLPFRLGRLPGDIRWEGRNSAFYFPLTTCLLLSAVFSVIIWVARKLR